MRKPRYYYESNFYHVMVQGDEKKYIFEKSTHKRKFLYLLKHNAFRNDVEIVAYCLMDNHVHLLLFCPDISRVSKMMSQCNTSYGLFFNKRRNKIGHVFRERFRSEVIYTKSHLINCIKYIHENPVKAHICDTCGQYYFSSFNGYEKMNDYLKEICGLDEVDLRKIKNEPHTTTVFMEDKYSKEEIQKVVDEILKNNNVIRDDANGISRVYLELKQRCKISDKEIANIFGIDRYSLIRKLKRCGIK